MQKTTREGNNFSCEKSYIKSCFSSNPKKGLEYAPGLYKNLTKRIKNQKVQKILNSDLTVLGLCQEIKAGHCLLDAKPPKPKLPPIGLDQKMGDGISNTQIQNFFGKEQNEDIRNNYVGVFFQWIT